MVVHHQGENFSAGANLLMILEAVQANQWALLDEETQNEWENDMLFSILF